MMARVYGKALGLMGAVALIAAAIGAAAVGFSGASGQPARFRVTATLQPVYAAVLHLTQGVDAEVTALVRDRIGCAHDYQLSPADMILLTDTDLLLTCGAGAEDFLAGYIGRLPNLPITDGSAGISLLYADGAAAHDDHDEHDDHDDHDEHEHLYNEHYWASPARYAAAVGNWRDGLCAADPDNAARYQANAAEYITKIHMLGDRLQQAAARLELRDAVIAHGSLSYLADDLGWHILADLSSDEDTAVSPAALSAACEAVRDRPALLLYDAQNTLTYPDLEKAGRLTVLTLDTAGSGGRDGWLNAMERTAALLEELAD